MKDAVLHFFLFEPNSRYLSIAVTCIDITVYRVVQYYYLLNRYKLQVWITLNTHINIFFFSLSRESKLLQLFSVSFSEFVKESKYRMLKYEISPFWDPLGQNLLIYFLIENRISVKDNKYRRLKFLKGQAQSGLTFWKITPIWGRLGQNTISEFW